MLYSVEHPCSTCALSSPILLPTSTYSLRCQSSEVQKLSEHCLEIKHWCAINTVTMTNSKHSSIQAAMKLTWSPPYTVEFLILHSHFRSTQWSHQSNTYSDCVLCQMLGENIFSLKSEWKQQALLTTPVQWGWSFGVCI